MSGSAVGEYAVHIKSFASGDIVAGAPCRVELGKLIPRVLEGKHAHLAGFLLVGTVQADFVAATMPGAMPGYLFLTAIKDINLEARSHKFIIGAVDGYDLYCDSMMRHGEYPVALPSDKADADAANATQEISLLYRCDNPAAPPSQRDDGCIPVALLALTDGGDSVLTFNIANTFDGFAGATIDGFNSLQVFAIVKLFDEIRLPTPHQLRFDSTPNDTSMFYPAGPCEYAVLNTRRTSEATPLYGRDQAVDNIHLTIGDSTLYAGKSDTQLVHAYRLLRQGQGRLGNTDNNPSATAPPYLPLFAASYAQYRTKMCRGPVKVLIGTRSNNTTQRILYRDLGVHNGPVGTAWAQALGIPLAHRPAVKGDKPGKGAGAAHMLDAKLG